MGRSAAGLWCPYCEDYHPCRSVNPSELFEKSGRRFQITEATDVKFFRRFRICENCDEHFETNEIESHFLAELVKLRNTLKDIKENAAAYEADANKAAARLKKLGKSLAALKALD